VLWAPFVFAFVLGGVIAGGVVVGYVWPAREPEPVPQPEPPSPPSPEADPR
jgi:hypothetical protein